MATNFYEMAKKNYPDNWNIEMVKRFVQKERITPEEFKEITGEDYS